MDESYIQLPLILYEHRHQIADETVKQAGQENNGSSLSTGIIAHTAHTKATTTAYAPYYNES